MNTEENGITVQYQCWNCEQIQARCNDCQDELDAQDTARAWELVDEGNLQYSFTLSHIQSYPSGHDWTERDGEFAQGSVRIEDGLDESTILRLSLEELDDETQRSREVECPWCHLMTPKQFNDCQDCDAPLELNVR